MNLTYLIKAKLNVRQCPVGTVIGVPTKVCTSSNWLVCDGSTYDIKDFQDLYKVLKSNILPDLRITIIDKFQIKVAKLPESELKKILYG